MKRSAPFLALACGLALLAPSAARADNLDVKLSDHMSEIVKHVKAKGYKNVGVLRFRAQKGGEGERFDIGPINGNLADRLENLLVMNAASKDDPRKPAFGIIHEAGTAAGKQKLGGWYTKTDDRKKLFSVDYPLAWGNSKVKADAFFTGKIALSANLKTASVTVECFDARSPATLSKVAEFKVDSDRHLVRDFLLPYTLTKGQRVALARSRDGQQKEQQNNEIVLQQAQKQQKQQQNKQKPQDGQKPGQPDGPATTQSIGGVVLKIMASGKEITPKVNSSQTGLYEMECPPKGSEIVFSLENTSDKELGVVLKVGGRNTIGEQMEEAENCRKWLIPAKGGEKKNVYDIKGYRVGEKFDSMKKFVVLSKDEAMQLQGALQDKVDLVEVYVFHSGPMDDKMTISRGVSARGLRGDMSKKARSNFSTLQQTLMKEGRWTKSRGRDGADTIGPDKAAISAPAPDEKDFPNPTEVKNLKIRIRPGGAGGTEDPPQN